MKNILFILLFSIALNADTTSANIARADTMEKTIVIHDTTRIEVEREGNPYSFTLNVILVIIGVLTLIVVILTLFLGWRISYFEIESREKLKEMEELVEQAKAGASEIEQKRKEQIKSQESPLSSLGPASKKQINKMTAEQKKKYIITGET